MNTTTPASRPAGLDTDEHVRDTQQGQQGPESWPLTLQVAVAFWALTFAGIAHGVSGGSLWPGLLMAIAIDYAIYLRTDGGAIVALLARAPWNVDSDVSDAGTGSGEDRVRFTDIVRETVGFARDEVRERGAGARAAFAGVTPVHKAHLLRAVAGAAGVVVALVHPALGVSIAILAGLDTLLHARLGVSAAALVFDEESSVGGAPALDLSHDEHTGSTTPAGGEDNVVPWRNAA